MIVNVLCILYLMCVSRYLYDSFMYWKQTADGYFEIEFSDKTILIPFYPVFGLFDIAVCSPLIAVARHGSNIGYYDVSYILMVVSLMYILNGAFMLIMWLFSLIKKDTVNE